MGDAMFSNPQGVMGLPKTWSTLDAEYVANAAVTAGQVVTFTVAGKVTPATTSVATGLQAGVATTSGAAGDIVHVVHIGLVYVLCDSGVTAGNSLQRSTTNAGQVQAAATTTSGGTVGASVQAVGADKAGYVLAFICPATIKAA